MLTLFTTNTKAYLSPNQRYGRTKNQILGGGGFGLRRKSHKLEKRHDFLSVSQPREAQMLHPINPLSLGKIRKTNDTVRKALKAISSLESSTIDSRHPIVVTTTNSPCQSPKRRHALSFANYGPDLDSPCQRNVMAPTDETSAVECKKIMLCSYNKKIDRFTFFKPRTSFAPLPNSSKPARSSFINESVVNCKRVLLSPLSLKPFPRERREKSVAEKERTIKVYINIPCTTT